MENFNENETVSVSKLWKKTGKKHTRVPFKEFVKDYEQKTGGYKNLIATDQTVKDAGFSDQKGSQEFAQQNSVVNDIGTFYTLNSVKDGGDIQPTDKIVTLTSVPKTVENDMPNAISQTEDPHEADSQLILFFVFGAMVGLAGVIIYNKYK